MGARGEREVAADWVKYPSKASRRLAFGRLRVDKALRVVVKHAQTWHYLFGGGLLTAWCKSRDRLGCIGLALRWIRDAQCRG